MNFWEIYEVHYRPVRRFISRMVRDEWAADDLTQDTNQGTIQGLKASIEPIAQVQLEQHQMSRCVQDKIHLLPEPLRVVLVLFDTMELSHQEIADILGIRAGNVKVRLHRARNALKEILERDCNFEHDERNVMVCLPKSMTGSLK